jgi:hypothetical protein
LTQLKEESVMGKNENRLLSAISPLYALSQGKLPGILGVGMSVMEDRKDKKEEEKMLRGQTTSQERDAAGKAIQMKAGGRVRPIDGCATRGKTKGRVR